MATTRRHKSKRRDRARFSGLYTVLSGVLILAAVVVACVVFFRVDDVVIQGNARYSDQEILEIIGVKEGDNLFGINRSGLARKLQLELPYIQEATIKPLLPDTLSITLTEATAAAAIPQGETWWLIDVRGKLLEETDSPSGCATVTGITPLAPVVGTSLAGGEAQAGRVKTLRELLAALEENGLLDKVDSLDLSEEFHVTFVYDGRFTVRLGSAMEKGLSYWLSRFQEALNNPAVAVHQRYTVDITDGLRLRFIPE